VTRAGAIARQYTEACTDADQALAAGLITAAERSQAVLVAVLLRDAALKAAGRQPG
jgi:hypothetical protein